MKRAIYKCYALTPATNQKPLLRSSLPKKDAMTQPKYNDYKTYSLFNDIEDVELRNRNRACVLANIAEDHIDRKSKRVSMKGAALILGYFQNVEDADKDDVKDQFSANMKQRGFALVP